MSAVIAPSADARLVRRAARGSSRALEAIFERYHQELYRYCAAIVGNSADAQDAVQNTMIKVLRALPGERREIELKPWLYRIAHNEAIEIVRRRVSLAEVDVGSLLQAASAAEEVLARENLKRILADIAELSERQRGALVMRELAGLDFEQIGAALSCSAASARQTLYEARLGLREMGEGREMDCGEVMRAISDGDRRRLRGRRLRTHLRTCETCQSFQVEVERRVGELALVSPLPVAAAAGIFHAVAGGSAGGGGAVSGAAGAAVGKGMASAAAIKAAAAIGVVVAIGVTAADKGGLVDLGSGGRASPAPRVAPSPATVGAGAAGDTTSSDRTRAVKKRTGGTRASAPPRADRTRQALSPRRAARSTKPVPPVRRSPPAQETPPGSTAAPATEPIAAPPASAEPGRHLGQANQQADGQPPGAGSKGKSATAPGHTKALPAEPAQPAEPAHPAQPAEPAHPAQPSTPAAEPSHPEPQVSPPEKSHGSGSEAAGGTPAAEHAEATPPAATGATGAEPPSQPPGRAGAIPEGS